MTVWAGGRSADQRSPGIVAPRGGGGGACPVGVWARPWEGGGPGSEEGEGEPYPGAGPGPGRRFCTTHSAEDGRPGPRVEDRRGSRPVRGEPVSTPPGNRGPKPSSAAAARGGVPASPGEGAPGPCPGPGPAPGLSSGPGPGPVPGPGPGPRPDPGPGRGSPADARADSDSGSGAGSGSRSGSTSGSGSEEIEGTSTKGRSSAAEGGVGWCMGGLPLRSVRLDRVRRRRAPTGQGQYGVTAGPGVPPLR